jgi:FkbM family methyltransferase
MPGSRSLRDGLVDAGFAVADRLEGMGLGRLTGAARRLLARAGLDEHTVEVDGISVGGSLADHGTYLHSLSGPVGRSFHLEAFREAIPSGGFIVDCGAHIGLHALVAADAVGGEGSVVAIEPVPVNARALRANVERNRFAGRVEVVEAAATRAAGPVRVHVNPWLDRSGLARPGDGAVPSVDVEGLALDDVMDERRFDVAKIDVEGAEALVLAGFERSLARSPGAVVFVECHPGPMRELGEDPTSWLESLCERGPLERVEEEGRRLVPADDAALRDWVAEGHESFNLRWRPER